MGLTIWRVLEYFSVDDMKFALSLINEPQTGNRSVLTERLVMEWFEHSKSLQLLLDILERPILANICQDYDIDHRGNKELLIRRLKKELDGDKPPKPKSKEKETSHQLFPMPHSRRDWSKIGAIISAIGVVIAIVAIFFTS